MADKEIKDQEQQEEKAPEQESEKPESKPKTESKSDGSVDKLVNIEEIEKQSPQTIQEIINQLNMILEEKGMSESMGQGEQMPEGEMPPEAGGQDLQALMQDPQFLQMLNGGQGMPMPQGGQMPPEAGMQQMPEDVAAAEISEKKMTIPPRAMNMR